MTGWQTAALSDVLADAKPGFACGEDPTDGVFQFRMNNITTEGQLDFSKKRRVPRETRSLESFFVEPGDILFNATNSPELVGKSAFFPGYDEPAVFSNHFLRLRPREDRLDGRYLACWLVLQFQRRVFQSMCRQWVNQATVGRDSLLGLRMPLPPLTEQRQIAKVLDQVEALRAKRRAALAQPDNLIQSIFLNLFGDSATNSNGWPTKTLGEVTELVTGYPFRSEEYVTNGESVRLCRGANVLPGRIDWSDQACWPKSKAGEVAEFSLKVGDVVIAMDRPWISEGFKIARVLLEDCPALLVQRVARIRGLADFPNEFLFHLLSQPAFTRHCRPTETTVPHISPKDIRSFAFHVPPIELQRDFVTSVAAVEKLKQTHRSSLAELDALFASLQHRAFLGEL